MYKHKSRRSFRFVLVVVLIGVIAAVFLNFSDPASSQSRQTAAEQKVESPSVDGDLDATFITTDGVGTVPAGVSRITFPFGSPSTTSQDFARFAGVQSDGKIVVVGMGQFPSSQIALARLNTNGTIDNTFGGAPGGKILVPLPSPSTPPAPPNQFNYHRQPNVIDAVMSGDKIVILSGITFGDANGGGPGPCFTGMNSSTDFLITVVNADGTLDTNFDGPPGIGNGDGQVRFDMRGCADSGSGIGVQTDGKIIVAGTSTNNDATDTDIVFFRLNTNGTLDTSYDTDGKVFYNIPSTPELGLSDIAIIQAAGADQNKVVMLGTIQQGGGFGDFLLNRLNTDGTIDMSFGPANNGFVTTHFGTATQSSAGVKLVLYNDGRILAAGSTSPVGGAEWAVARYNSDGALDTAGFDGDGKQTVGTFVLPPPPAGGTPCTNLDPPALVAVDGSGKVIMGSHTNCGGNQAALARLTSAGALDATFGTGGKVATTLGQNGGVNNSVNPNGGTVQPDGKILMVGQLNTSFASDSDMFVARFQNGAGGGPPTGCLPNAFGGTNNTPQPINDLVVTTSTITIAGAGTFLTNVKATTFITHPFPDDLDMTLTSPAGTVVTISSDNGIAGGGTSQTNAFNGTVWDDFANPFGALPYSTNNGLVTDHLYTAAGGPIPRLVPEEPFDAFRGENPNGVWTLRIFDDFAPDTGTLNSWSLNIQAVSTPPTLNLVGSFSNNTPQAIPTTAPPIVLTSTINVAGLTGRVEDVDALLNITHTANVDLDVTVQAPSGRVVTLTTNNGGTGDNGFAGTTFDNDADPGNQVPFPGTTFAASNIATDTIFVNLVPRTLLTPEESLGAFRGEQPNGIWTLTVSDVFINDGGSLNSWGLNIVTNTCPLPSAAGVEVAGRVTTSEGYGLRNARVTLTDQSGAVLETTLTSAFGFYRFSNAVVGQTYIINVGSKRYTFTPRVIQVFDNISDADFVAEP